MEYAPGARINAALAAAQGELLDPKREKSGQVKGKSNYRYAGLDDLLQAVRAVLPKHGLSVSQPIDFGGEGKPVLRTILLHSSGERIESCVPLAWSGTPQDKGSELTYMRRYSLESIVGVAATSDDDAASASTPRPAARQQHRQQQGVDPMAPAQEEAPAQDEPEKWDLKTQRAFFGSLSTSPGPVKDYDTLCDFLAQLDPPRPRPSVMTTQQRTALLTWLSSDKAQERYDEWQASLPEPGSDDDNSNDSSETE
jgi:hypothetical protein